MGLSRRADSFEQSQDSILVIAKVASNIKSSTLSLSLSEQSDTFPWFTRATCGPYTPCRPECSSI